MAQYILRLDDASEYMDRGKWLRIEQLLDSYGVKPLVGVIPCNRDPLLAEQYERDGTFWDTVSRWQKKGWAIAMHGYDHRYITNNGGINPVNARSEFAGLPYEEQAEKIMDGVRIFREEGIEPTAFFAPSHTFDKNTVQALLLCSNIRVISDTVANRPYQRCGMTFVPQQSGRVRKLPFHTTTFCYHPNTMGENAFEHLNSFLRKYGGRFIEFPAVPVDRERSMYDCLLSVLYFAVRKLR